jgi:carbon-monoxide dehydrogenase iron sulfur subunit
MRKSAQMRIVYVNEAVCIGCRLCEVYCRLQHAQSKDLIKAFKKETPRPINRVRVQENGVVALSVRCQQCEEAPCVQACITGAMERDPVTSEIRIDQERCVGCWTCLLVCPLGAIRQGEEQKKALKCDLCPGEEIPRCVANCPNEALSYVDVPGETVDEKIGVTAKAG